MTILEKVHELVHDTQWNFEAEDVPASVEKMIIMAYYIGKEEATRKVSDAYAAHIAAQHQRAASCRYHRMAAEVVGPERYLYEPDYAGNMTASFGSDLAML